MRIDTKMKKLQKYIMILETVLLCTGFSARSKQPDFDAKSYVQSSLDAYYHGEYKDYANLLELSEKDAKKSKRILMRASKSNLMIPITLRIKELLIIRKNCYCKSIRGKR